MQLSAANPVLLSKGSIHAFFADDVNAEGLATPNLLRHVYAALISHLPPDIVRTFWKRVQLVRNGVQLSELQLVQLLWESNSTIPLQFQLQVLDSIESFFEEEELDYEAFKRTFFHGVFPARFLSARAWLSLLRPHLEELFAAEDRREFVLRLFPAMNCEFYPHAVHEMVGVERDDSWIHLSFIYSLDNTTEYPFDYQSWMMPWLMVLPEILGLPPVEKGRLICDVRNPQQLLPGEWTEKDEELYLDGELQARLVDFGEFCAENGVELPADMTSGQQAWLPVDGSILEQRSRQKIIYGGPLYVCRLSITPISKHSNPLDSLLEGLLRSEARIKERLDSLHKKYLEEITRCSLIVFHQDDDSISINGKHFIRNVPAKIFRKVVRTYILEKRNFFENREFKRDSEITLDVTNPNFEGRLNRLMAKLNDEYPELQLIRKKRGGFHFLPKTAIEYREE